MACGGWNTYLIELYQNVCPSIGTMADFMILMIAFILTWGQHYRYFKNLKNGDLSY